MRIYNKLISQLSHYFVCELLVMLSGFISFPFFTRILTVSQYGIMSLVSVTLWLTEVIVSGGLRTGITRFSGEFKFAKGVESVKILYSTIIISSLFLGIFGTAILAFVGTLISGTKLQPEFGQLLSFSAFLIFFRIVSAVVQNIYRVEGKSKAYSTIRTLRKYFSLALGVIFIVYMSKGLQGIYGGMIISEGIFCLFLLFDFLRTYKCFSFSKKVFNKVAKYSIPLLTQNLSGFIASLSDRYLIAYFLGSTQVGIYSAGYRLAEYVQTLATTPLNRALIPVSMNLWSEAGSKEIERFLSKFLRYFWLLAMPVIFGLTALGRDLIRILATLRYIEAASIIPYVITGILLNASFFPIMAGLYFHNRTGVIALLLFVSAIINLGANFFLIPAFGIVGAAVATLLSYVVYILIAGLISTRYLRIQIPFWAILKYAIFAAVMYMIIILLPKGDFYVLPLLKIPVGTISYVTLVFLFDQDARDIFFEKVNNFFLRRSRNEF